MLKKKEISSSFLLRSRQLSKATIMLLLGSMLFLSGCDNNDGGGDDNQTQPAPPPPSSKPTNQPPKAVANATQTSGYEGIVIEFNAKGSEDPDGSIEKYHWYENGSTVAWVPFFERKYDKAGTYKVKLTVTDNDGASATSNELTITIKAPIPAPAPIPPTCSGSSAGFNIGNFATEQKTQYYTNDDGDLQRGLARHYIRDNAKETVCDTTTNLMWQDNADVKTVQKTWDDAVSYCANLTLGGFSDWRLPNGKELLSLMDYEQSEFTMDPTFQNIGDTYYWSSTPFVVSTKAWSVKFKRGYEYYHDKTSLYYVRCVRN